MDESITLSLVDADGNTQNAVWSTKLHPTETVTISAENTAKQTIIEIVGVPDDYLAVFSATSGPDVLFHHHGAQNGERYAFQTSPPPTITFEGLLHSQSFAQATDENTTAAGSTNSPYPS